MRCIPNFALLQRVIERENEYHDVKKGTKICQDRKLTYGLSFYGASYCARNSLTKYKRVEVWCSSCPSKEEFLTLYKFFNRNVPKCNNSVFAYVNGELFEVNS